MVHPTVPTRLPSTAEALQSLDRTIDFQHGEFALVLAHCNDADLPRWISRQLLARDRDRLDVVLPSGTQTLYRALQQCLGDQQPTALIVRGLDRVQQLDDLLVGTNRIFNSFSRTFPFPIVLWVDDRVLRRIAMLAPDMKSRAPTCVRFAPP